MELVTPFLGLPTPFLELVRMVKRGPGVKRMRGDDVLDFWGDPTGSYLKITLKSGVQVKSKGWPWVQAALRGVLGREKVEKANFLRDGSLLIKTKNKYQADKLMQVSPCSWRDA